MMTPAKPKVLGYVRVSTAEQVDGYGLDVQRKAIRTYCRDNGLRLVAILSDEGISGSNGLDTRQGLADALGRIESGEATGLVVYRLDRLARDFVLQETIYRRLTDAGHAVLSVKEPEQEGDQALKDVIRQVLGAISQYERAVIRSRMAAGKAQKAAQGGYVGGRPAYGTSAPGDGTLRTDDTEAAVVALILKARKAGKSYRQISADLATAGHRNRSGKVFHPDQLRRIAQRAA